MNAVLEGLVLSSKDKVECYGSYGSGTQEKYWVGNTLVKLDTYYKEAEKEVSASKLGSAFGLNIVQYEMGKYSVKEKYARGLVVKNGCECKSYLTSCDVAKSAAEYLSLIDFRTLNQSLFDRLCSIIGLETQLGINTIQTYIIKMLVFDFLICNEDRHFSNFEFIYNSYTGRWRFAPIFDNGRSFLGRDLGTENDVIEGLKQYRSQPFSSAPMNNLCDMNKAVSIAKQYYDRVGGSVGLKNMDINDFHKLVVIEQFRRLIGE